jgi:ABC-type antimicrobial peptide transport system permease subunit
MDNHPNDWLTIVGVVGDVRQHGLDEAVTPVLYLSYRQRPERVAGSATIVVRGAIPPDRLASAVRETVRAQDPNVPVTISSMRAALDRSVAARRLSATVLSSFGVLALFLAALGIYGVLAYTVAQRGRELSVRLALGAAPADLRRMVLADGARAVLPGVAIGAAGALLLARTMRALLYGVSATDPLTLVVVAAMLVLVAALASYIPAWRATRADPAATLRQ